MIRVIQVGLGDFGRSWAAEVRGDAGCRLVAVVDRAVAARQWASEHLHLAPEHCYETLEAGLAGAECDAVLVVTPEETHYPVARIALEAGKHVLIEKPMTTSLVDAHALVDLAARTGRIVAASQNYRYRKPARTVQKLISEGVLGKLVSVHLSCHRDTRSMWPSVPQRYQMRHPYVIGMAIHHFDLLRMVTGQNVHDIYARSWRVPDSPYRHDPAVIAVLGLEGGATVTYEGNWATHGAETSWNGEWEITGEAGRLLWRSAEAGASGEEVVLHIWGQPPRVVDQVQLPYADRLGTLEALRRAIESGQEPETSAADNLYSVAILEDCLQSLDTGELVNVAASVA